MGAIEKRRAGLVTSVSRKHQYFAEASNSIKARRPELRCVRNLDGVPRRATARTPRSPARRRVFAERVAEPARVQAVEVSRHGHDAGADAIRDAARQFRDKARFVLRAGERVGGAALGRLHQARQDAAIAQDHAHPRRRGQCIARRLDLLVDIDRGPLFDVVAPAVGEPGLIILDRQRWDAAGRQRNLRRERNAEWQAQPPAELRLRAALGCDRRAAGDCAE